jgi:hypothetical protein
MNGPTVLKSLLVTGLILFATSATAGVQHAVARSEFAALHRPLRNGARVTIPRIPLAADEPDAVLELERFQVWADHAEIKVYGANDQVLETLAPPPVQYFRGTVAGKPDSIVFLSVHGENLEGVIFTAESKYALGTRRFDKTGSRVIIQESSIADDITAEGQSYTCDLDGTQITAASSPRQVMSNAIADLQPNAAPTGTQRSVLNIAVDTDYELFMSANIAGNSSRLTTYIGNLMGGVSTIYSRDLLAEVRVVYLGIQTSAADPFTVVPGSTGTWNGSSVAYTSSHALAELGDRWHNTPPSTVRRSGAMLISGKPQTAGVAWINTLCDPDFAGSGDPFNGHWGGGYSFCGGIAPTSSLSVPDHTTAPYYTPSSDYWPLLQVSHELGHNVGSAHTHCVLLTPEQRTQYNVTRAYVDTCYAAAGCYSGPTALPAETGTIMSYCHNLRTSGPETRFTFGQPNEASQVIVTNMRGYLAAETPSMSAITAPSSLGAGVSGNASVTSVAGMTYAWTISNGTITSASNTAAITFTGSTTPVVLTVTATNTSGCGITDYVSVSINANLAAPANVTATATSSSNVALTWNAVPEATGYDVWRKANVAAPFAQVDSTATTSFNDGSVSANTAYLYQVRATGGAFSASELAATTMFTDPDLVAGSTRLKSAHLTELLTAVNAVRTLAGLGTTAFATPATVSSVSTAAHVTTLRAAINGARTTLGIGTTAYTDSSLVAGSTPIRAVHITELRAAVR